MEAFAEVFVEAFLVIANARHWQPPAAKRDTKRPRLGRARMRDERDPPPRRAMPTCLGEPLSMAITYAPGAPVAAVVTLTGQLASEPCSHV